jgi:pyruvate dehydrogenase E2 component (dihydrolipoamide acetyltransferase)
MALQDYPEVNASFSNKQIKVFDEINIGIAMAVSEGLIVPVIHRANKSTISEIDQSLKMLRERAIEGKFRSEELMAGTITISNLGMYGVDAFQAIINPPEAAILALGRIREIPVGIDGQILLCPMMNIRLSIDHRVLDGVTAARFLMRVKGLIEECQFSD